jgi:hypothetical protein
MVRPAKPDPHQVGYIIVCDQRAGAQAEAAPVFIGWCPMNETAAILARVRRVRPGYVITDWFASTRRIGNWHHKTMVSSRLTLTNADWYHRTEAVTAYLNTLRRLQVEGPSP